MAEQKITIRGNVSDAIATIKHVCNGFGWELKKEGADTLIFQTPTSILSWGESVEIKISTKADSNSVDVLITSSASAQLIDWGKSRGNVEKLVTELQKNSD
jgi:hypothetical protein